MKQLKAHEKIKAHLDNKGLKYNWLCRKVEISTGHLSNIFSGLKNLTPELIDKINKALGTDFKID
jgi:plasmid maintenance system antidote protein VapI